MERVEDLLIGNLKIYQDDEEYCFTSDAVLLSRFCVVKKGDVIADFCSGSGIVGLHTYALNQDKVKSITLFEMQPTLFALSKKTIEINSLQDKFFAVNSKVQEIPKEYNEQFSLIVCNPPYQKRNSGFSFDKYEIAVAREEIELTLSELIKAIAKALKFKGRVNMVHRADRLCEVIYEMRQNKIEPKKIQFVYSGKKPEPYLVLIEGVKGANSGLKYLQSIKN